MLLLQVFAQWTDVAPVLTKHQHVNYQQGLFVVLCVVIVEVTLHWTLCRPLCCVTQALERGTTTGRWATSWRDRTWWRTCMNPEMTEPGPSHIWTVSHLDSSCIGTNSFIYQDTALRTVPAVHSVKRVLCFRRWTLGFPSQFLLFYVVLTMLL